MHSEKESETKRPEGSLAQLFVTFFKIGSFTFGGGWAMISIIEREIVDNHRWLAREEFLDLLAIAQSLPGILAVNIASVIGDNIKGSRGAVTAALGSVLPSFAIILCIAIFLTPDIIKNNHTVSSIFMGIRPAVVALIVAPVINAARTARLNRYTIWIPALVALMISAAPGILSNPILYIVAGGLGGWLYNEYRLRTEGRKR